MQQHTITDGDLGFLDVWDEGTDLLTLVRYDSGEKSHSRQVSRSEARAEWRRLSSLGWFEIDLSQDDDEYVDEDAMYEAAVDSQMSRVYSREPNWAI